MTGGVVYLTEWGQLNGDSVLARTVPAEDAEELHALVREHHDRTGSPRAAAMLDHWPGALARFRQVVPVPPAPVPATAPAPEGTPKPVG
jgi:glutamate synthase (NADPH/NADH) large chain